MKRKFCLLMATTVLVAQTAFAAVTDEEFEQLRQQLAALSDRLEELAEENAELKRSREQTALAITEVQITANEVAPIWATESWHDRITVKGDLRLRHESIDEEGEVNRGRGRFRARVGLSAEVTDSVNVVAQFASGADNPVSRNQSFDGGFSTKEFGLDLIYADWAIRDDLHLVGGKMKNPFFRPGGMPLIWDSDMNPEGVALTFSSGMFFGSLAHFSVEERFSSDDSLLSGAQAGIKAQIADAGRLTAGLGYYDYTNTIGNAPFFDAGARGNTVDLEGNLIFDYNEFEIFAQYDLAAGGLPLTLAADFVRNSGAAANDTGYAFGIRAGTAGAPQSWEAAWAYQDVEADSVIATFSDSDFGGGGTDATGHIFQVRYALRNKVILGGTLFLNEIDENAGNPHDFSRLQLDMEYKFD